MTIGRRKFIILATAGTLIAGGTALGTVLLPGERARNGPPSIRLGAEQCGYCGMVISDARFAAAWREASGREQHFDDIGCMVNAGRHRDPGAGTSWWVTDYRSQSLLEASTARYVFAGSIRTPMDYGVAALARSEDIGTLTQSAAPAVSWDEARERVERTG